MSVTFYPEAIQYIKQEVPCFCDGEDQECYDCKGTGYFLEEVPSPEFETFNVSNINAALFLRFILPEISYEDLCGSWDQSMQDRVTKNVLKLMNKQNNPLLREDEQVDNFYTQGINKERAMRYCELMLEVLHCCKKHNCNLIFN